MGGKGSYSGRFTLSFIKIVNAGMNKAKKEKDSEEVLVRRGDRKVKAICNLYFMDEFKRKYCRSRKGV